MNDRTKLLLETLEEEAEKGNRFAESLMLRVLVAIDPDAEADRIMKRTLEAIKKFGKILREAGITPEKIDELARREQQEETSYKEGYEDGLKDGREA